MSFSRDGLFLWALWPKVLSRSSGRACKTERNIVQVSKLRRHPCQPSFLVIDQLQWTQNHWQVFRKRWAHLAHLRWQLRNQSPGTSRHYQKSIHHVACMVQTIFRSFAFLVRRQLISNCSRLIDHWFSPGCRINTNPVFWKSKVVSNAGIINHYFISFRTHFEWPN